MADGRAVDLGFQIVASPRGERSTLPLLPGDELVLAAEAAVRSAGALRTVAAPRLRLGASVGGRAPVSPIEVQRPPVDEVPVDVHFIRPNAIARSTPAYLGMRAMSRGGWGRAILEHARFDVQHSSEDFRALPELSAYLE